jgi:hypothetical protein
VADLSSQSIATVTREESVLMACNLSAAVHMRR